MRNAIEMVPYYSQDPAVMSSMNRYHHPQGQHRNQNQGNYMQMYIRPEQTTSFTSVPMDVMIPMSRPVPVPMPMRERGRSCQYDHDPMRLQLTEVITEQPITPYGSHSQQSQGYRTPPGPDFIGIDISGEHHEQRLHQRQQSIAVSLPDPIGIPLPGLQILDRIPSFKISTIGVLEGRTTCVPAYRIFNLEGDLVLNGYSETLFCPFDSKHKSITIKDAHEDCIFKLKFTPSVCECDSEEKRCFAMFSPAFDNPFGAILFESGQLKYSMKILNALEGETYAVDFLGAHDISIKRADGTVVAIINIHRKRGQGQKYALNFMEELSSANKALFIGCTITLNLVSCETVCTRCICLVPVILACLAIIGLSFSTATHTTRGKLP